MICKRNKFLYHQSQKRKGSQWFGAKVNQNRGWGFSASLLTQQPKPNLEKVEMESLESHTSGSGA